MIKRSITYKNIDGKEITEDWYFHFRSDELVEMQVMHDISAKFQRLQSAQADEKEAVQLIKMFVQGSVGQRSDDGRKFSKKPEILEDFVETGAYSALFFDLLSNPKDAAVFVENLMPADMEDRIKSIAAAEGDIQSVALPANDDGSAKKPSEMSREELIAAMRERNKS